MKKNSVFRKVFAVLLAVAMLTGTGFTAVGSYVGTSVSVSAAKVYGDFEYNVNDDSIVTITKYTGNGGDVTIPSTIDGKSVMSIGGSAFYHCETLTGIDIPEGITQIGWGAFYGCKGLTSITIPNSVTYMGGDEFDYCTALESITVNQNNSNYSSQNGVLFDKNKTKLITYPEGKKGDYTVPDTVKSIGSCGFLNCMYLTNITIPDGVTNISGSPYTAVLFEECTGLENIIVNENNSNYSSQNGVLFNKDKTTLRSCPKAIKGGYVIPEGITKIGWGAFYGCKGLTSITIPASVTLIERYAFYGCTGLTIIYGTKGSCAETYANENNIPFVSEYSNISTISSDEIVLGETVTVNAKAVLGDGDYTYAVLYKKKADTKWTVKQNYSTNDTIVVKPAKATDYDVCVKVKDSTGKIVKKFFEVKVNAKLANTSTISATTIKKGDTVTLNGSATGGMGDYTYAVLYKKKAETKWTTRQGYKDNSEILVRPYTNTDYDICIKVKDNDGTIAKKYFTVTVTK